MNRIDLRYIRKVFLEYVPIDAKILDVGCGIGANLSTLKEFGYLNVIGVDISKQMVNSSKELGHQAFLPDELIEKDFDVIFFSHVIEHLGYPDIVKFLEFYFSKAKRNAQIVIVTPTLYDAFFNDVDHIKPYFADGLMMLFSQSNISRQYSSQFELSLKDIYFRRAALTPYHVKCKYGKQFHQKLLYWLLFKGSIFLKIISFGVFSKVTGYTAIFDLNSHN